MSKRARNDATDARAVFPAGDVDAFNRNEPLDVVEPGHYLSGDVPQKVHEELAASPDGGWTLIDYTPPGAKQQGQSTAKPADKE
jgi:hypothetical protein